MKYTSIFILALFATGAIFGDAHASHTHANTVVAHNISMFQHTITQNSIRSFGGSLGASLGGATAPTPTPQNKDKDTYMRTPMYGRAAIYGEYNDDGSWGRSGGNTFNQDATLNGIWLDWQHGTEDVHFNDFARMDSDTDIIMAGISGGQIKLGNGMSKWGIYTGYIDATQENRDMQIHEQGGFFGIYNGNTFGNFGLYATVNGGVLDNTTDNAFGTDEHTNFWVGGAFNATYNIILDKTFTLQPGIGAGYTWIKSENYTSASGALLANDAFGMIQVSPALRAIKHIGSGWFGTIGAQYVMTFDNGGDLKINGITSAQPEIDDYIEYGLTLEKSISSFSFSAHINRRDGARDGWIGGANIKIRF